MSRSYEDVVEVRGEDPAAGRFRPQQFLWRGRVYLVRGVISHWYERSAWWQDGPARAVHGESVQGARTHGPGGGDPPPGQGDPSDRPGDVPGDRSDARGRLLDVEREVWRVEASPGRAAAPGVYDLCAVLPGPRRATSWRLQRVDD